MASVSADAVSLLTSHFVFATIAAISPERFSFCLPMRTFFLCALALFSAVRGLAAPLQYQPTATIDTGFQHLSGLAIADFNGDKILDIAVTDGLGKRVVVYLGRGDGTFAAPVSTTLTIDNTTSSLVAGDFNEDGKQDLIVATVAGDQVDLLLVGNGDGTFTQTAALPGSFGFINAVAVDINHDSHVDLIGGGNGQLYVHLGDGHGNFTLEPQPSQGQGATFIGLAAADFTGDGNVDFVVGPFVVDETNALPLFFRGVGDGTFAAGVALQVPLIAPHSPLIAFAQSIASADFNGDHRPDLLIGSGVNIASVMLGNGDGSFDSAATSVLALPADSLPQSPQGGSPLVATADIDGNGTQDAVTAGPDATGINVFLNDGTGRFGQPKPDFNVATDAGVGQLQLGDLNGDGLPDIVVTNYVTGKISLVLSVRPPVPATVTLAGAATQGLVGGAVSVAVSVGGPLGVGTGTVQLVEGTTVLTQQTLDASGRATLALATLPVGSHVLAVAYAGDSHYRATTGASFTTAVTDFGLALGTASQTVTQGATATYSVAVTPLAGFAGTVTFSCSGLTSGSTCTAQPDVVSGQATTVSLVVSTAQTGAALGRPRISGRMYATPLLCLLLGGVLLPLRRRGDRPLLLLLVMSVGVGMVSGCGGSSSNSGSSGSTPRTRNFTITGSVTQGSQTVTHQVAATLVVQ